MPGSEKDCDSSRIDLLLHITYNCFRNDTPQQDVRRELLTDIPVFHRWQ
ncbi:MAG: hypothetical protein HY914_15005 [Desulfomonile tiedjei]|nr:hypothetical protein [Desulfomonile tiedjei]